MKSVLVILKSNSKSMGILYSYSCCFPAQEFLDRRKMTEFGSLALVDEGAGDGDGVNISLPGVRRGMMLPSATQTSYDKA